MERRTQGRTDRGTETSKTLEFRIGKSDGGQRQCQLAWQILELSFRSLLSGFRAQLSEGWEQLEGGIPVVPPSSTYCVPAAGEF